MYRTSHPGMMIMFSINIFNWRILSWGMTALVINAAYWTKISLKSHSLANPKSLGTPSLPVKNIWAWSHCTTILQTVPNLVSIVVNGWLPKFNYSQLPTWDWLRRFTVCHYSMLLEWIPLSVQRFYIQNIRNRWEKLLVFLTCGKLSRYYNLMLVDL